MEINIPPAEQARLAQHAAAAGYDDVERYVKDHVLAIAHYPTPIEMPPLSDKELQASLEMCDRGMAEAEAGKGRDFREALDDIAEKHGLNKLQ